MGCWSVSCGISNIAITAGHKCVLLPIKENRGSEYGGYLPACLPIFGEYDDYGGIENIEKNDNTEFIEVHLGISIEDLATFLVDGKFTYNRDEAKTVAKKLEKSGRLDEVKNWQFMWIDRDVYDFMITNLDEHEKGYMDYGTPEMLKLLGFTLVEEGNKFPNYDPKRFNKKYQKGDVYVYSDGRTLLAASDRGSYIYHFGKGDVTSIETHFEVPEELHYLKNLSKKEAWRLMDKRTQKFELGYILGVDRYSHDIEDMLADLYSSMGEDKAAELSKEVADKIGKKAATKAIDKKYLENIEIFGDRIVQLTNIRHNMHAMSGRFHPHVLYLTPQCGEFNHHQKILDKFAEINKQYTYVEEEV